jgi:hypothetical protein
MTTNETITILHLIKALPAGASHEEQLPEENEGCIIIDAPRMKQWASTGTASITTTYWKDIKGSRKEAIRYALEDIKQGIEPANEETIHACGW